MDFITEPIRGVKTSIETNLSASTFGARLLDARAMSEHCTGTAHQHTLHRLHELVIPMLFYRHENDSACHSIEL